MGDPLFDNPIAILPGNPVLGHKMSHLGYAGLIRRSYFLFKSLLAESECPYQSLLVLEGESTEVALLRPATAVE